MNKFLPQFKTCLQKEIPFCASTCPFHLDVVDFVEKMGRGALDGAYKTYRNAVGFPQIVGVHCPQTCKGVCPLDCSIELLELERACISLACKTAPPDYNLPLKNSRIAIIGFGISGMGCLLRLATKKYQVTVFEKSDRPGGVLWDLMDSDIFLSDLEKQLQHETYEVHYNHEILNLEQLSGFDAIYIATGNGGNDFGLLTGADKTPCKLVGSVGLFIGGTVLGKSPVEALADGLQMGTTIDNFLKTKHLNYDATQKPTAMVLDSARLENQKPPGQLPKEGFNKEQALQEANRCIRCQCDACRNYCDLTEYYNRWPLRIRDEIQATTLPGTSEVKSTPAKRLISTCTQCGLCLETCPQDIDLGGLILAARKNMHKQGKLPWAFHEFWIRDMEFTNSDLAAIRRNPPSDAKATLAFFPGCQLGASDPVLVQESYNYLLSHEAGTGLILSCCGIPAAWGGDENKTKKALLQIQQSWEGMGRPTMVLACPTCKKYFAENLPEVPCIFLYDLMAKWGVEDMNTKEGSATRQYALMSVFDPCSTHSGDPVRKSVREILGQLKIPLAPLRKHETFTACCSYGGQGSIANPDFAKQVVEKRIGEGANPYVAYCINCRDAFIEGGKPTYHLLDLLFDREPAQCTISQRRENRITLKKNLLKDIWGEEMEKTSQTGGFFFQLEMDQSLREKLSKSKILEEDMKTVIAFCERTGRKTIDPITMHFSGYCKIGHGTYWTEYQPTETGYWLFNGYSHRIEIELEGVWNGTKVKTDL